MKTFFVAILKYYFSVRPRPTSNFPSCWNFDYLFRYFVFNSRVALSKRRVLFICTRCSAMLLSVLDVVLFLLVLPDLNRIQCCRHNCCG